MQDTTASTFVGCYTNTSPTRASQNKPFSHTVAFKGFVTARRVSSFTDGMISRLSLPFEQIAEVESKCGVLHIVMGNGLELRASLLSNDCQVWFPGMDEPTVWESVSACYAQLKQQDTTKISVANRL